MTLHAALSSAARLFPQKTWISFEDKNWTYAEGDSLTDRIAAGLMDIGVKPGDRVALLFTNCTDMVFSYYACFKIGAMAVPINTRFQTAEIAYVLNHSEARILIGQHDLCSPLLPMQADLPHLEHVFIAGTNEPLDGALPLSNLYKESAAPTSFTEFDEEQLAALLYTSGTTARPKGVMHSHATLHQLSVNLSGGIGQSAYERTVIAMPLCHIVGFGMQLIPVTYAAGTLWLAPRFDPKLVLQMLEQSRATYYFGVPVHINMLINCPDANQFDLSSLRRCGSGGDCVPIELQNRFKARFGVDLDEGCGMTEVIYSFNQQPDSRRPGSIGKPFGDLTLKLLDADGNDVPPGEIGEIVAFSRSVTLGYWNDTVNTSAAIRDGGMRSGDLGRLDEDGYYWFVGRMKDIIIRGGSNISPGEVEDALYLHPAVYEAGVIGVPDPHWGEIVCAYVALKPGASTTKEELQAHVGGHLAAYKVPERIVFVEELPKGPTGKIHRKTLRETAAQSLLVD